MRQKAKNCPCRYKIIAVGIDRRGNIIDITRNSHRSLNGVNSLTQERSWHAEEILIFRNPPTLSKIIIARFNKNGKILDIKACNHCAKLAKNRGIEIESISNEVFCL